jgi:hypothetical protein
MRQGLTSSAVLPNPPRRSGAGRPGYHRFTLGKTRFTLALRTDLEIRLVLDSRQRLVVDGFA